MNDLIVTCYLLLVTIGGGVFGRQNTCYDLIVICYLLLLGVAKVRSDNSSTKAKTLRNARTADLGVPMMNTGAVPAFLVPTQC